jgi:hypothetical protein
VVATLILLYKDAAPIVLYADAHLISAVCGR